MQHSYRGSIEQWLAAGVLVIQAWKRVVNIPLAHRTRLISPSESLDSMVPLPWCLNDGAGQPSRLHHCPAELAHVRGEVAGKRLRQRSGDESCWQVLHAPSTLFCKGNIGVNNNDMIIYDLYNHNWMACVSLTLGHGLWALEGEIQLYAGQHVPIEWIRYMFNRF